MKYISNNWWPRKDIETIYFIILVICFLAATISIADDKKNLNQDEANKNKITYAENGKVIDYGVWYKAERIFVPAKGKTSDDCIEMLINNTRVIGMTIETTRVELDRVYAILGRLAVQQSAIK